MIVGLCIGVLVPVCLFFAAWWVSVGLVPERFIFIAAFGGLGAGIVLDACYLKRWIARAYETNRGLLALLYLWVSVITYVVSMGFPVPLLVPGAVAGAYAGRRLMRAGAAGEELARGIRRTSLFTTAVIGCASVASGFLALRERTMGRELERMFNFRFEVNRPMIVAAVLGGGVALVAAQYFLTRKAALAAAGATNHDR